MFRTRKMIAKTVIVLCLFVGMMMAHPTMYKLNENSKLEPDLVPVSSTVIPLPIYQVGYGIDIAKSPKGQKTVIEKPDGPVTLITVHSKKKPTPMEKLKSSPNPATSIKEVDKQGFTGTH